MWGFIVALISGALMSIQGVFNTEVTKQTSLWGWLVYSAIGGRNRYRAKVILAAAT